MYWCRWLSVFLYFYHLVERLKRIVLEWEDKGINFTLKLHYAYVLNTKKKKNLCLN